MAKRDKRIQKRKKRQVKIRQLKARRRNLNEVRDDADFANQPPDELENNLFELLMNESSVWVDEREFDDVYFNSTAAMVRFISGMENRGVEADDFFSLADEDERTELMWEVIAEITPMLVTEESVAEIADALEQLERRWGKNKKKSADVTGIALVRTMLTEFAKDDESAEALSSIGLMQMIAHRSIMRGFSMGDPFDQADELLKIGEEALFNREIELGLYTEAEVDEAGEQFAAMQLCEEGTTRKQYLKKLVGVVRKAVGEPNRASEMSAKITAYIDEHLETLSDEHKAVLLTMTFFLNEGEEVSFYEIERQLVAAMFGEIGRSFDKIELIDDEEE